MGGEETSAADTGLQRARDLARRYADEVRAHLGPRLRSIRLYGSAARGDWSEDSDVDVIVLLDSVEEADAAWLARRAFELGVLERGTVLQPIFMTAGEFDAMRSRERLFALDVEREGIAL